MRRVWYLYLKIIRNINNYHYKNEVRKVLDIKILNQKIKELDDLAISNKKKIFYIIRRENRDLGLLTYVAIFLGHIAYAVSKGYIPIIDMQSFKSIYLEKDEVGKKNAWELYFKQPYDFDFNDVINNEKCIYSPRLIHPISPFINSVFSDKESIFWKTLSHKFIILNDNVKSYIDEEFGTLIKDKKVLGLLYRGTDYIKTKPSKHPIQPTLPQFAEKIEKAIVEWGDFDYFYLATDELAAVKYLEGKFPGKIIVNKRVYYDVFNNINLLAEAKFNRENDNYLKGLEYLSSIILLSRCDSIIAGLCAGTYAANYFKEGDYAHKFFFDLGVYS